MISRKNGFTLIELVVAVALIAIVASIAVPSFTSMIANNQVTSATNTMVGFMSYARSEAVKRGRTVNIRPVDGSDFASGYMAWTDDNNNGSFDSDEELRRVEDAAGAATSMTASVSSFGFRNNGYRTPSGATNVSIDVCNSNISNGQKLIISFAGIVRSESEIC